MPKKIEAHRLGDLVKITSGGTPSKEVKANWGGDMPWISASSMKQKSLNDSALKLTEQGIKSGARIAEPGDVLLLVRGSELHNSIPVGIATRRVTYNQDIKSLRCGDKISSEFLYYWLKAMERNLLSKVESTGIGAGKIDSEILKGLEILLPEKEQQNTVAKQFKALDDKIELNRKMNETLKQMAQALFKSWFIDFEPAHAKSAGRKPASMDKTTADLFPDSFVDSELGNIPKGWRPATIGNCCERIFSGGTPNTSNSSFWGGDIPWLSSGETREGFITETEKFITQAGVENSSTRHARKGCTAIASAGQGHTRGQTSMLAGDFYVNQSVIVLESKKGVSTDLFNYFMMERRYEELRQLSDSNSSRGSLTTKLVAQMPVVLPPPPLLSAFDKFATPLVELIVENASQTRSLCAIRDSLLPQLLAVSNNSQLLNIT